MRKRTNTSKGKLKKKEKSELNALLSKHDIGEQELPVELLGGPFCVADKESDDMPLVFVNEAFCNLTEYDKKEIEGRNCRFLQRKDQTDPKDVARIRELIEKEERGVVRLLNFTKSGKAFINIFLLCPLRDTKGKVRLFLGYVRCCRCAIICNL